MFVIFYGLAQIIWERGVLVIELINSFAGLTSKNGI